MIDNKISVIMAVYNGEKYIKDTIDSILNQEYNNFELIIVDDCSQDRTVDIIQSFRDSRIILLRNDRNMKLAYSLNRAIEKSSGYYIARMDADDICAPNRFTKQVKYMEQNPSVAVLGGCAKQFGASEELLRYPKNHEKIKIELLFGNPLCHPAVMFRKDKIGQWYDPKIKAGQDYELWSKLIWEVEFHNLSDILVYYRIHSAQTRNTLGKSQKEGVVYALHNMMDRLGEYSDEDAFTLALSGNKNEGKTIDELKEIKNLYARILSDVETKPELMDSKLLWKRMQKQYAILIYASLIYKTISWKDVNKTGLLRSFLKRPELVVKALIHSVIR